MKPSRLSSRSFLPALFFSIPAAILLITGLRGSDCNHNGKEDAGEIQSGTSPDCNRNGVPDECDLAPLLRFESALDFKIGAVPQDAALADLDGDGDLDLAAAATNARDLFVLLNLGDGTFDPARKVPAVSPGTQALAVAAGDLDGDGDNDLAVVKGPSPAILLLENQGAASFKAPRRIVELDFSSGLDVTDAIHIFRYLFQGGNTPRSPFFDCGLDDTPDALTCGSYPPCGE